METKYYRVELERLCEAFPGKGGISPQQAAHYIDKDVRTVRRLMKRPMDPLPHKTVSQRITIIPIASFAKWLGGQRV